MKILGNFEMNQEIMSNPGYDSIEELQESETI
jgi:hypothetical protein